MHRADIVCLLYELSDLGRAGRGPPPARRGGVGPAAKGHRNGGLTHNFYFFYAITAPSQPLPSTHYAVRI